MRGCPSWKTSNTEVIPASAPALINAAAHGLLAKAVAAAAGSPR
jgi:hypothetical protein